MSLGYVGVNLNTEAGLVLNREVAILPEWAFMGDEVGPPIYPFCEFVDAEAAHGSCSMGRCDRTDRACRIVSGCPDLPHVCQVRNAFRLEQAARFWNVDVNSRAGLALDQRPEAMHAVEVFPGADGCSCGAGQPCHGIGIFWRKRVLDPPGLEML